ncbi:MAG: hypothetical protein KDB14_21125 [Planctomycetales bacterium]|nr:hypothetical protein [Planctomycetales bacterium]
MEVNHLFARKVIDTMPGIIVVFGFDSHLLNMWMEVTSSKVGILGWTLWDDSGDPLPFQCWQTPANQAVVLNACDTIALSDNPGMLIDAASSEAGIAKLKDAMSQEESGSAAIVVDALQAKQVEWVIIPFGPDSDSCVIASLDETTVRKMADACRRDGINILVGKSIE